MASKGDLTACGKCEKEVKENDRGVQCEICEKWNHIRCEGIGKDMYSMLQEEKGVKWFCSNCRSTDLIGELRKMRAKLDSDVKDLYDKIDKMGEAVEKLRKEGVDRKEIEDVRTEMRAFRTDCVLKKDFGEVKKGLDKMKKEVVVKSEVDEIKKTVSGLKSGELVKTNVENEVRKSFAEIMASEKQKEEIELQSRARERDMEVKLKEVLERDKRRTNVVLMGLPEESEEVE